MPLHMINNVHIQGYADTGVHVRPLKGIITEQCGFIGLEMCTHTQADDRYNGFSVRRCMDRAKEAHLQALSSERIRLSLAETPASHRELQTQLHHSFII